MAVSPPECKDGFWCKVCKTGSAWMNVRTNYIVKSAKTGSTLSARTVSDANAVPPSPRIVSPKRIINGPATAITKGTIRSPPNQARLTPRPAKAKQWYRMG
jgi:hypothetical protein